MAKILIIEDNEQNLYLESTSPARCLIHLHQEVLRPTQGLN